MEFLVEGFREPLEFCLVGAGKEGIQPFRSLARESIIEIVAADLPEALGSSRTVSGRPRRDHSILLSSVCSGAWI